MTKISRPEQATVRRRKPQSNTGNTRKEVTPSQTASADGGSSQPLRSLDLEQPGQASKIKGVLFGPPKSGKTVGACSGSGRKLLIMMEPDGDLSLRGRDDIDVLRPKNAKDVQDIVATLRVNPGEWEWIIFDSVTFMWRLFGADQVTKALTENRDPRRDYMRAGMAVNQIIADAVQIDSNLVFIVQMKAEGSEEETNPDPEVGEYPFTLAVTPMVYKELTPSVSFLGRTYKTTGWSNPTEKNTPRRKVVEYWVSFEDYGKSPAGARLPVEPQVQGINLEALFENK